MEENLKAKVKEETIEKIRQQVIDLANKIEECNYEIQKIYLLNFVRISKKFKHINFEKDFGYTDNIDKLKYDIELYNQKIKELKEIEEIIYKSNL